MVGERSMQPPMEAETQSELQRHRRDSQQTHDHQQVTDISFMQDRCGKPTGRFLGPQVPTRMELSFWSDLTPGSYGSLTRDLFGPIST